MKIPFNKEKIFKILRLIAKPVIALVVAVILCTLFANQITRIGAAVKQTQTLSFTLQKRIETISKMKDDLNKIGESNYAKIENALISTDNVTDIVVAFDDLADKHSLHVTPTLGNLTPTGIEIVGGQKIATIDYSLSTLASINTFLNFLKEFEKLTIMPVMSAVDVNGQAPKGWTSNANISVRGKLYVRQN